MSIDTVTFQSHIGVATYVIDAREYGYPGDCSGGDLWDLVRKHPDKWIYLPKGTYSVQTELDLRDFGDREELVIHAEPGTTLRIDSNDVDAALRVGRKTNGLPICSLRNLEFNLNGHDAGIGRFRVAEYLDNENISITGRRDHYHKSGDKFSYFSCITQRDGVGFNRRIRLPDGDVWSGDANNTHAIGMAADPPHVGTQFWIGCHVAEYWDNGMYIRGGVGTNVLLGCTVENCGRSNIRLGRGDVAVGCRSVWDLDPDHEQYPEANDPDSGQVHGFGTLLSADAADGTSIIGGRVVNKTGQNDCVRTWSGAGQISIRDLEIDNRTDQWAIRLSANDAHSDSAADSIAEQSVAKLDNVIVREESTASVRGAAVCVQRPHAVIDSCTYVNEGSTQSRAFLEVTDGNGARVVNSSITSGCENVVRLRNSPDTVAFDGCTLNGGIDLGAGESIEILQLTNCDMRLVDALWTGDGDWDNIKYAVCHSNPGLDEQHGESS